MTTHSDNSKPFSLSSAELAQFHRDGYLAPIDVYPSSGVRSDWKRTRIELLDHSHSVYGRHKGETASGVTDLINYDRHLDNPFLAAHICRPEIVDRVVSVLGPDVLCWRSEFFPKYPGDEGTDWHQADTFANASGKPQIVWPGNRDFGGTITVWTAFTDSTVEMGCLQFIPGTHRSMHYDETKRMHYSSDRIGTEVKEGVARGFFGYDYRELQIDPNWQPDEQQAVSIELKAGQSVMFWSTLMHASHPHRGNTREMRLGYVARYVPTQVLVYPDTDVVEEYGGKIDLSSYGAVLVSGQDQYGCNRLVTQTTRGQRFPSPRAYGDV